MSPSINYNYLLNRFVKLSMGAGYGFLRDAQNNAKKNRENLKDRTEKRKNQTYKSGNPLKFKEASTEELENYRLKLLRQKKKEKNARTILLLTLIIIFGSLFYYLILA